MVKSARQTSADTADIVCLVAQQTLPHPTVGGGWGGKMSAIASLKGRLPVCWEMCLPKNEGR